MRYILHSIVIAACVCTTLSAQNIPESNGETTKNLPSFPHPQDQHRNPLTNPSSKYPHADFERPGHRSGDRQTNLSSPGPQSLLRSSSGVDTAWVRHYGSKFFLPNNDRATSIAVDGNGNVYVTGSSAGVDVPYPNEYFDYATIKYNSSGDTLWTRRYNGPNNFSDVPISITVDGSGNVYVTGSSYTSQSVPYGSDYATIKYNSSGDLLWVRRFDNGGATCLAVDGSGNVYVTGWSTSGNAGYATIKYNSNGDTLWVRRYNDSPENTIYYASSLVVDGSGNVYVTGTSNTIYGSDYATIKYNSNGDMLWVKRYQGGSSSIIDGPSSLAVDGSGNVYVTGSSYGSSSNYDYVTIKYNSNGDSLWVRSYNGSGNSSDVPTSLALDGNGNVYVTGNSGTIKYNSAGVQQWIAPGNRVDLAIDGSSNVYVTGSSGNGYYTIKYNSIGDILWAKRYNGIGNSSNDATSLAVDGIGNVYVTGGSEGSTTAFDYATIKYNSNGDSLWVNRYCGQTYSDGHATSLAVDGNGNVSVTGTDGGDYATIKYNSGGDMLWARRYNGPGNSSDEATSLAVDESGNVYITGSSSGDYATIKYNPSGDTLWVRRYNGPGNANDSPSSLAVDGSGNVYVTGGSVGSATSSDYATIKYNSNGDTLWVRRYDGPENSDDRPSSLAVDGSGNVYVTGGSGGPSTSSDYATIKYNSNGDTLWVRRYNGVGNYPDYAYSLAVDGSGNVYVTGASGSDFATIKYNSSGDTLWVRKYNDPGSNYSYATSLAVDGSGNVYVTGNGVVTFSLGGFSHYITIKYNSSGDTLWVRTSIYGVANSLNVDIAGNVYVTGSNGTIKYNSSGDQQWIASENGVDLVVDASRNVYIAGSTNSYHSNVYTTIKYVQTPTFVEEKVLSIPSAYRLEQNYPNPFNPSTMINYQLAMNGYVTLKVFDILGREVTTLVNEERVAGSYTVRWDAEGIASGVYFYQLRTGNFAQTKKLMLMK